MANDVTNLEAIVPKLALSEIRNNVILPRLVNSVFSSEMPAAGKTVRIAVPKPASTYTVTPGSAPTYTDVSPAKVDIDVTANHVGSAFLLSSTDIDTINRDQIPASIKEAAKVLVDDVEIKTLQAIRDNVGGIYGTTSAPDSSSHINKTILRLNKQKAPTSDRNFLIDPDTYCEFLDTTQLANADTTGESTPALVSGYLGTRYGANFYQTQNISTSNSLSVTSGTIGTNGTAANNQGVTDGPSGSGGVLPAGSQSMHLDGLGLASGTIKKGQKFKFSGLEREFCVTADATASSNEIDVEFAPMLPSEIADNTTVTFYKSHDIHGVAFTKDLVTIAYLDFEPIPASAGVGTVAYVEEDPLTGIKIRFTKTYENNQFKYALEVCYGVGVVRPECGAILGKFTGTGTNPS
jgi:hypothetical protein